MFPLSSTIEFSTGASLALAVLLGLGFGFSLERAGFGSARKLTAVFYLWDMAVVKVMFTAIVTAMAGLFVLSSAGLMDLSELYLEPTNYAAQILGGLVFGVGFLVGLTCLVGGMEFHPAISVLGFVVMLASTVLGVTAWQQAGHSSDGPNAGRGGNASERDFMGRMEDRWRRRQDDGL